MITFGRLRKLLPSSLYYILYQHRLRHRIVKGTPQGIDFEVLNQWCLDHLREPLRHVSHVHLSGWKTSGAFRLLLRTKRGRFWSLVYKNAIYTQDHIPAATGLPAMPGPPEYLVYKHGQAKLTKYLPRVYLCVEIIPGLHYRYLLEDLRPEYRPICDSTDMLRAATELHAIHVAMNEWLLVAGQDGLLRFDREFSAGLLNYARENLERYIQETADKSVSGVLELWPQVSEVHQRKEFYEFQTIRPIHGDYNRSNIHFHTKKTGVIRIVDWEWAGMGIAHRDLVSLLKGSNPEIEQQAFKRFCEQDNSFSFNEHKRLYRWCQLERGLLDGAFLAKQQIESPSKIDWVPGYIEASMQQILYAYQELV